ncbi:hypothetical protein BH11PSE11_BH11PSE11_12400 [soil metagenome]
MAAKHSTAAKKPLTYQDVFGSTVQVERGEVLTFLGVKSEQLRALTQILTTAMTNKIQIPCITDLQLMANEYAFCVERLTDLVSLDTRGAT